MPGSNSLSNADSIPFWQGAREGRLMLQRCTSCSAMQFPPRYHCATCWAEKPEWRESKGAGVVESFTIVRRAPSAAFRDKVPYVTASVILDDGPRMIATVFGDHALNVSIGDRVEVDFADNGTGTILPVFRIR